MSVADFTQSTGPSLAAHFQTSVFNTSDLLAVALRCNRRSRLVAPIIPNNGGIAKKITPKQANETRNRLRRVPRFHNYQEMNQRMQENAGARADDPPPAAAADDDDDDDIMMLFTDDEDDEELEAECSRKLAITQQALDTADNAFDRSLEFEGEEDEREEEEVEGALAFDSDVTPTATPTKSAYSNLSWEEECRTPVLDDAALKTPTGVSQSLNDYDLNTPNDSTGASEFLFESDDGETGKGSWLDGGYYDETTRVEEFLMSVI